MSNKKTHQFCASSLYTLPLRPVPLWQGVAWECAEEPIFFTGQSIFKLYHLGNLGIGHTRYSTSAGSEEVNCQPFVVHSAHGALAVAHNGELFNAGRLRRMVTIT